MKTIVAMIFAMTIFVEIRGKKRLNVGNSKVMGVVSIR